MAEVIMLGTGRAVPTARQENTYFVVAGRQHTLLVDCAGAPYRRLLRARVDPMRLTALVLTHNHPDHVYGVPSLLLTLWLIGRREPLDVCGPDAVITAVRGMMALYESHMWPGMFALRYHGIALETGAPVITNEEFEVTAAPGVHFIPTVGLRFTEQQTGAVFVYSADTEPCDAIQTLARGANLLLHEATGDGTGHSSAAQAGAVAQAAGVGRLVLTHYDRHETPPVLLRRDARRAFNGRVSVARDFSRYEW
jgi:ribonuclease Z